MSATLDIAVAGLHLSGQPLNPQLISLGAKLKKACLTAALYKMYLINDEKGRKPGLAMLPHGKQGSAYEVEVWEVPMENVGKLLAAIPPPLGLGTLLLEDNMQVKGFICEPRLIEEGEDISGFTGWRAFLASLTT